MKQAISIYLSAAVLILLSAGCSDHDKNHAAIGMESVKVRTGMSLERTHERSQRLPGTVFPSEQAVIAAKIMATVDALDLAIGQEVSEGDVLVQLKADEIDARVQQAQAALAQIERNLERESALLLQNATTAETVRTLQDQKRLAMAQLAEAKTMESYKSIRAPFDGTITSKKVRRGDLATPGIPLLTIDGKGPREIHVQVPDSLATLPRGTNITVEADGHMLQAVLSEWSPAADPQSRSRLAKLDVADVDVRSGQYVGVNWPAGKTTSVWVPDNAISRLGQMERVYSVKDGTARLHLVRTASVDGGYTQITSGLLANEIVILDPQVNLRDGQSVVIEK